MCKVRVLLIQISILVTLKSLFGEGYATGGLLERSTGLGDGERIVNGVQAKPGEYSYTISLRIEMDRGYPRRHACGGSLIAPNWILTAAHCVRGRAEGDYECRGGVVGMDDDRAQKRQVEKIFRHPNYKAPDNDFALLKLKSPYEITDKSGPNTSQIANGPETTTNTGTSTTHISLVQLDTGNFTLASYCSIAGWGLTEANGHVSDTLLYANVNAVGNSECREKFDGFNEITDNMVCYGGGETDTCNGDSGGPVTCNNQFGNPVLVGVTSFGKSCATPGTPGVYARVSSAYDWIMKTMKENS